MRLLLFLRIGCMSFKKMREKKMKKKKERMEMKNLKKIENSKEVFYRYKMKVSCNFQTTNQIVGSIN